jgi:hypothetical protein
MLGGKHAFRVNLPACTHYRNSKLLVWHRADTFRDILCDACGQCHAHLFLPIGGYALWINLYSGSDIGQCWLLLSGRADAFRDNLYSVNDCGFGQLLMLGGKHAFRVNLPACTHYGNSELLMWRREDAFRNIVCDAHG